MSPLNSRMAALRSDRGFSLIELLVAMLIGLIVSLAAFGMLEFTTSDVSRITERAHVDQTGRVALEKIMLQLHSACVAQSVTPIQAGSNAEKIKFISETSPLNKEKEPTSELGTVRLREVIYTPASGSAEGTLIEKSRPSTGTPPEYKFTEKYSTEHEQVVKLLTGVKQTTNEETKLPIPVFQYYRYYQKSDTEPVYGQLDPAAMTITGSLKKEEEEAKEIAKVTVSFTLAPEGKENTTLGNGRPVALEDSAIFRLETSSEASGTTNLPCTQTS